MKNLVAIIVLICSSFTSAQKMMGIDANYALDMSQRGFKWNSSSDVGKLFQRFAKTGSNGFRVRVWTNDDGVNGLKYAIQTAKLAQAAGLKPYLVLFLSDSWADLVKQPMPAVWKGLSGDQKLVAIENYTSRVVKEFAAAGVNVDTFEIGNEIDFGICGVFEEEWPKRVSLEYMSQRIWPQMLPIIAAAERGVKAVKPDAKFILHISEWDRVGYGEAFWKYFLDHGVAVDYAGVSYFPTAMGGEKASFASLGERAKIIQQATNRPVLICETGFPAEEHFTGQFADWNKPVPGYALSVEGQKKWIADLIEFTKTNEQIAGVYFWSPEWYESEIWQAFAWFDREGSPRETSPSAAMQPHAASSASPWHVCFGNLHSHTAYSDGTGTPEEAYKYARDVAKLDFLAITEHNHLLGGDQATPAERTSLYVGPRDSALIPTANRFNEDGKFVAMYGQEFSSMSQGNHVNIFDVNAVIDVPNGKFDDLLKWMDAHPDSTGHRPVMQFNHPGLGMQNKKAAAREYGRDDFGDQAGWISHMSEATETIEILNGEPLPGVLKKSSGQMMESYFQKYLQLGFKLAPVGDQDNHKADWGTSTETRTGIIATELTRASLINALRERHVYATEDKNLRMVFTANGELCGGDIKGGDASKAPRIEFDLNDDDEPKANYSIEVYLGSVGGEIARSVKSVSFSGHGRGVIEGVAEPKAGEFVYFKVTQKSDAGTDHAWSAPVWFVK